MAFDDDELRKLREENEILKLELARARDAATADPRARLVQPASTCAVCPGAQLPQFDRLHDLSKSQVERYSRQLLLPSFGVQAQDKLCKASVLVVGCGGLGSPAALYLAAMGVGKLGLVDRDGVEASNLHRQIAHTERRVGVHKALSAQEACHELNSSVDVQLHMEGFTAANAVGIVDAYDVVLDCSDNPATRYLISDACAVSGKPLVSGAAVGTDGQLTVYCGGEDAPCYRCLFPESPAPENCSRCSDAGVLGVVPGVIGTLQALEAVKLLAGVGDSMARRLLIFDGLAGRFMNVKLRAKRADCVACGTAPEITAANLSEYDYEAFTGQAASDGPPPALQLLAGDERISVQELQEKLQPDVATSGGGGTACNSPAAGNPHAAAACSSERVGTTQQTGVRRRLVLLDVRPAHQYAIMSLPGARSFPFSHFDRDMSQIKELCSGSSGPSPEAAAACTADGQCADEGAGASTAAAVAAGRAVDDQGMGRPNGGQGHQRTEVLVICRRGNDSQRAVMRLRDAGIGWAKDVLGGYTAWAAEVDTHMPVL